MKNIKLLFSLLMIATTLVSCKCFKTKSSEKMINLDNTTWKLITTKDKVYSYNEEKPDGISISFEDGNFSSSDGCNAFGGEYKSERNTIEFGQVRATMRYCDQEYMAKFGYYVPFHSIKKFEIKDNKLYLYEEDGKTLVAEYEKK